MSCLSLMMCCIVGIVPQPSEVTLVAVDRFKMGVSSISAKRQYHFTGDAPYARNADCRRHERALVARNYAHPCRKVQKPHISTLALCLLCLDLCRKCSSPSLRAAHLAFVTSVTYSHHLCGASPTVAWHGTRHAQARHC